MDRAYLGLIEVIAGERNDWFTWFHLGMMMWNEFADSVNSVRMLKKSAADPKAPLVVFERLADAYYSPGEYSAGADVLESAVVSLNLHGAMKDTIVLRAERFRQMI